MKTIKRAPFLMAVSLFVMLFFTIISCNKDIGSSKPEDSMLDLTLVNQISSSIEFNSLMKNIKKYKFSKVYDLQNSSRTFFYKRILFPNATKEIWSSTETTLPSGTTKQDFDKDSVFSRNDLHFEHTNGANFLQVNFVRRHILKKKNVTQKLRVLTDF